MSDVLAALLAAGGLLLVGAGAAKVADPSRTAGALGVVLGRPVAAGVVRVGAAVEVLVGAAVLVIGGVAPAVVVAASYVAFAGFVALALRRGAPVGSCGCFGEADTPPRPAHVVVDGALAAGALGAALVGGDAAHPLVELAVPAIVGAFVVAVGAYLVLTRPGGDGR